MTKISAPATVFVKKLPLMFFTLLDDGLAYVVEGDKVFSDPGGPEGLAVVPDGQEEATIESAEECPGECIYLEV